MVASELDLLFAKTAKTWEGTPFVNQQSSKFGCDCVGLIIGVAMEMGYDFTRFDIPSRPVNAVSDALVDQLRASCIEEMTPSIGSVLTFTVGDYVQHCAILVDTDLIVHGDREIGKITMINYPETLRRRLVGIYRLDWEKGQIQV